MLGICLGAQLLGNSSEEGSENGLGWINMNVNDLLLKCLFESLIWDGTRF